MEFKLIENELRKEYKERLNNQLEKIQTEKGLNYVVRWILNKSKGFKGDLDKQREKTGDALKRYYERALNEELNKIKLIQEAKDFTGKFIITIEWRDSKMWGSNPRAFTNYGFEGSSIGGYGYDKLSTATAQALNNFYPILKVLLTKEEKRLNELYKSKMSEEDKEKFLSRRNFIGYGSGYGSIPSFEGGVGVSCHERIINNLGLKWTNITSTKNTDVFLITKE